MVKKPCRSGPYCGVRVWRRTQGGPGPPACGFRAGAAGTTSRHEEWCRRAAEWHRPGPYRSGAKRRKARAHAEPTPRPDRRSAAHPARADRRGRSLRAGAPGTARRYRGAPRRGRPHSPLPGKRRGNRCRGGREGRASGSGCPPRRLLYGRASPVRRRAPAAPLSRDRVARAGGWARRLVRCPAPNGPASALHPRPCSGPTGCLTRSIATILRCQTTGTTHVALSVTLLPPRLSSRSASHASPRRRAAARPDRSRARLDRFGPRRSGAQGGRAQCRLSRCRPDHARLRRPPDDPCQRHHPRGRDRRQADAEARLDHQHGQVGLCPRLPVLPRTGLGGRHPDHLDRRQPARRSGRRVHLLRPGLGRLRARRDHLLPRRAGLHRGQLPLERGSGRRRVGAGAEGAGPGGADRRRPRCRGPGGAGSGVTGSGGARRAGRGDRDRGALAAGDAGRGEGRRRLRHPAQHRHRTRPPDRRFDPLGRPDRDPLDDDGGRRDEDGARRGRPHPRAGGRGRAQARRLPPDVPRPEGRAEGGRDGLRHADLRASRDGAGELHRGADRRARTRR